MIGYVQDRLLYTNIWDIWSVRLTTTGISPTGGMVSDRNMTTPGKRARLYRRSNPKVSTGLWNTNRAFALSFLTLPLIIMDTVAWRPQQLVKVEGAAVVADAIRWLEVDLNVHPMQEEDTSCVILNEVSIHPQGRFIVLKLEVQLHLQVSLEQGHPCRKR